MSVEHMAMVFAADGLDGGEKLLLLAYTNYTDPHGYCWPGEERLAEDTGTSVSTVRRTKKKLIGKNLVKSVRRPETSNLARVNLPLLASMGRPRKAYDDNEIDRLSFEAPASPETGPDQQTVQSDLYPPQASDLRTEQSDLDHRSDCSDSQVRLTCPTGQSDLQSISDPPDRTISRPSVPDDSAEAADGGMDGGGDSQQEKDTEPAAGPAVASTPGIDLLLAIGAEHPEFLLTGRTLRDQGRMATGMLLSGWSPEQLRQVIAGRPLPQPVKASVGAIVARRLSDAAEGPAPSSAARLPGPSRPGGYGRPQDKPTPTPPRWEDQAAEHALDARPGECVGEDGMCGRPTVAGYDRCRGCLGWAPCGGCYTRHAPPGALCDLCVLEQTADAVPAAS